MIAREGHSTRVTPSSEIVASGGRGVGPASYATSTAALSKLRSPEVFTSRARITRPFMATEISTSARSPGSLSWWLAGKRLLTILRKLSVQRA